MWKVTFPDGTWEQLTASHRSVSARWELRARRRKEEVGRKIENKEKRKMKIKSDDKEEKE